ncbi:MAG: hypothetical protein HYT14_00190 [Candidatus Liptonbacteria bacterium]|nr:hypothetical protein [Candidatus Liptonbacteria bacterium]
MKAKACMQKFAAVLVALAVLVVAAPMLVSAGEAQTIGETGSLSTRAAAYYKAWSKLDGSSWNFLAPWTQENIIGSKADYLNDMKAFFASFKMTKYEGLVIRVVEPALAEQLVLPENAFLGMVTVRAEVCLREDGTCHRIIHQSVWSWQKLPGTKVAQWYMVAGGGKKE